jgi:hypothetical protein
MKYKYPTVMQNTGKCSTAVPYQWQLASTGPYGKLGVSKTVDTEPI